MKENALMRRSLLGLLVGCMALFALATPTPAKAAVWCGWYWGWYNRCYVAYTVVRPIAVRPVVNVCTGVENDVVELRTCVPTKAGPRWLESEGA